MGRDFYKSKLKYLNSFTSKDVIGFDLFINWDEPIILCEGVFDAMSFKRNAIPLFGKTMSKRLHKKILQQKVKKVFLALDDDAQLDAMKISEKLMNEGIDVRKIDLKNGDPNDIGFKKLTKMLGETEETNFLDLMKYKLYGN